MKDIVVSSLEWSFLFSKIRNSAMANEISEEEYCDLQMEQWSKFYSGVVQYQEVCTIVIPLYTLLICKFAVTLLDAWIPSMTFF